MNSAIRVYRINSNIYVSETDFYCLYLFVWSDMPNPEPTGTGVPDVNLAPPNYSANVIAMNPTPRLPDFDPSDPELWFVVVEACFTRTNVTDTQRRYLDILAKLPPRYIAEVRDIVIQPVDANSYATLKQQLIKRLSASQEQKTKQLLENEAMGDDKPSQFLRRLRALAGSVVPEALIRSIWVSRLPDNLQPILATLTRQSLSEVAELADNVFTVLPTRPTVAAVTSSMSQDSHLHALIGKLTQQLSEVRGELASIKQDLHAPRGRRDSDSHSRSASRTRSTSSSREPRPTGVCWYHWRFKRAASKCTAPCSWNQENRMGSH